MDRLEEIDLRIAELKKEMEQVEGTPTEVYARIVGYYRPVSNWNKGKRAEFDLRKAFTSLEKHPEGPLRAETPVREPVQTSSGAWSRYLYFSRPSCPNCPPVAGALSESPCPGTNVDVDTEDGFETARTYGVLTAPTVIFLDENGNEVLRASNAPAVRSAYPAADAIRVSV